MILFGDQYRDRRVFLTGDTGFKGSWFTAWLYRLGASVCGFSNGMVSEPNHYSLLSIPNITNIYGDIRDASHLAVSMARFQPEIVFHFAAQPLVRKSYHDPLETFSTNVMGTANVLQACRQTNSVRTIVVITTDKVYENREWPRGYQENDALGGHDPYATSKACAEMVSQCFRKSFLRSEGKLLATCRAGNVIGGGDWAEDRLIPDSMRAASSGKTVQIRMPNAVRPWEHVLEPLAGYLLLGQKLLEGKSEFAESWNFGPEQNGNASVGEVMRLLSQHWEKVQAEMVPASNLYETTLLMLDCSKARELLNWKPVWNLKETIQRTVEWYKNYYECGKILTWQQLEKFIESASQLEAVWTQPATQQPAAEKVYRQVRRVG